jgi:hypothetical protein
MVLNECTELKLMSDVRRAACKLSLQKVYREYVCRKSVESLAKLFLGVEISDGLVPGSHGK